MAQSPVGRILTASFEDTRSCATRHLRNTASLLYRQLYIEVSLQTPITKAVSMPRESPGIDFRFIFDDKTM